MAIKNIIAMGVGFTSDGTKWIPTHGYSSAAPPPPSAVTWSKRNIQRPGGLIATLKNPWNRRRY